MHVFDFFKQKLYRKTTNAIDHNYHTCEVRTAILAYSIVILRCDNLFLSLFLSQHLITDYKSCLHIRIIRLLHIPTAVGAVCSDAGAVRL